MYEKCLSIDPSCIMSRIRSIPHFTLHTRSYYVHIAFPPSVLGKRHSNVNTISLKIEKEIDGKYIL